MEYIISIRAVEIQTPDRHLTAHNTQSTLVRIIISINIMGLCYCYTFIKLCTYICTSWSAFCDKCFDIIPNVGVYLNCVSRVLKFINNKCNLCHCHHTAAPLEYRALIPKRFFRDEMHRARSKAKHLSRVITSNQIYDLYKQFNRIYIGWQ